MQKNKTVDNNVTNSNSAASNKSKTKRILSMLGIILLLGLYVFSLVAAIMAKPYADGLFLASLFATFIIPVFIYVFLLMSRTFGKGKEGHTMHEINQMKKKGFKEANRTNQKKEN